MATSGGHALRASLRASRATAARLDATVIEIGFKNRRVAPLALIHEYGLRGADGGVKLPTRPAFRQGVQRLDDVHHEHRAKWRHPGPTHEQLVELAIAMRDVIRKAYTNFHGTPLSERQKARKEGTPFQSDELIGAEGPKLIGHIHAYVDGLKV